MGLGKTVQALALLQQARNDEGSHPSLVVAPTSVLPNWEREAERFTPGLRVAVWHGQDRRERIEEFAGVDLVLTSYALVRRDREELGKTRWRYVVLDEAQNIKNAGLGHRPGGEGAGRRPPAGAHRHAAGEPAVASCGASSTS